MLRRVAPDRAGRAQARGSRGRPATREPGFIGPEPRSAVAARALHGAAASGRITAAARLSRARSRLALCWRSCCVELNAAPTTAESMNSHRRPKKARIAKITTTKPTK